jgi:hypothetical protein
VAGEKLGKVTGGLALCEYFRLEKGLLLPHEYYIPKRAIARSAPGGVHLTVTRDDLKVRGWDQRPTERVETLSQENEAHLSSNGDRRWSTVIAEATSPATAFIALPAQ